MESASSGLRVGSGSVMTTDPHKPTVAGRLLELRSLIQTARWTMLDAVVMLNEIYEQAVAVEQAHTAALGSEEPEPNHEDYTPEGDAS